MSKQKANTTIRNGNLFCLNCGDERKLVYPMAVSEMTSTIAEFDKRHKDCKPVWKQPEPNPSDSIKKRQEFWLSFGEHGTSSKTIFSCLSQTDLIPQREFGHPLDPDDFKRCYLLLKAIPEWRERLYDIPARTGSVVWGKLVENWDKLTEMYEQNIKEDWKNAEQIGLYQFMKSLGC